MTSEPAVQAQRSAVEAITAAVASLGNASGRVADGVAAALRQAEQRIQQQHDQRVAALHRARAAAEAAACALRGCRENCQGLERLLAEARRAEEVARRRADASAKALAVIGEAGSDMGASTRTFVAAVQAHVPRALGTTRELSGHLNEYVNTRAAASTAGRTPSTTGSGPSVGSPGVAALEVQRVRDDRTEPLAFDKTSREQVEWGIERLKAVVEPAVERGKGQEYFAARDAAEGLNGERSYSGVYRWFYSDSSAIKVSRVADGSFSVVNGYHRLAVARELGVDTLPGMIK